MRSPALGLLLVVACDGPPPHATRPGPPVLAAVAAVDPSASASPTPVPTPAWRDASGALARPDHWLPGPVHRHEPARDPAARLALDQGCRRCHTSTAREHAGSQHAGAWSSNEFRRAFAAEPRAFCQRCHAPEEDAATAVGEVSETAASLGVGCVTCHVQPGTTEVWAAPRADAVDRDAKAPHPIARAPAFAGPQACAACHEFPFPDQALRGHPLAMQSTIAEHARSPAANVSCSDCHMPRDDGHRSHAFAGAYDPAILAQSLEIEATRPDPTTVRLRLAPGRVGHAVPTGDLLRRLAVRVTADGTDGTRAYAATRTYGRRFAQVVQPTGVGMRDELADDRVGMGSEGGIREATFTLPAALAGAPVRWEVLHQRVALASPDPRRAPIEGELSMASGVLPP